MNRSQIKKDLIGASYLYHRDRDARLESVQVGSSQFRLVRTNESFNDDFKNYIVQTPKDYKEFSCADIRVGEVKILTDFTLSEIKNSKNRESFARRVSKTIHERFSDNSFLTLDSFMS